MNNYKFNSMIMIKRVYFEKFFLNHLEQYLQVMVFSNKPTEVVYTHYHM